MNNKGGTTFREQIGWLLNNNTAARLCELILVFLIVLGFIILFVPMAKDNLVMKQAIIWIANIIMLSLVWMGMRLRGESCVDFGLSFVFTGWKTTGRIFLLSLLVFVLAVLGFIVGSIIMANITGIPENADMSAYAYLQNNIGMFLLTLLGVLIVSSFGEEVIYRGFLITRLTQLGAGTKKARVIAIILSSIVFGLIHYDWGPMGIVQTGFMGLALALCYIKLKRNLWIVILAHAYMDIILMTQMYLQSS